jgi:HAD superfamily hydrolase (TIGR01456 family)
MLPHVSSASALLRRVVPARTAAAAVAIRRFASVSTVVSPPPPHSLPSRATPAIAFDIDGVLLRGKELLPTARSALAKVTKKSHGGEHPTGIPHVYLTNGGGVTEEAKAKQLSKLFGIEVPTSQIILSHTPMQDLVDKYKDKLILTFGMTDVRNVAQTYGFKHVLIPE